MTFRDEDLELFGPPNPALTAILNGNQLRAIALAEAQRAKSIYVGIVAHGPASDDPHLYESASAFTERELNAFGSRWVGVMEVNNDHLIPHDEGWNDDGDTPEYHEGAHDLNHVLDLL